MTAQRTSCTINISFADDRSEHAQAAIEFLRDMPLSSQSKVTALAVLIPRETANHALLETILDQTRARLQSKDILLETELKRGYPGEILLEYAEQHKPDLIVMGAKGLRATLGILLGGVAQHVIEYANCPVIIIRAPYTGLHNILVVSDGSQSSQKAVAAICCADEVRPSPKTQIPLPAEANYHVAHVLPPLPSPELLARSFVFIDPLFVHALHLATNWRI